VEPSITQDHLKGLIKSALVEVLEQRQDLLRNAVEDALEEIALPGAIEEGSNTEIIGREEVFDLLEGKA
jgi:hypothetical protein